MTWTTPRTWPSFGTIASGTGGLNEQLRDNLTYLKTAGLPACGLYLNCSLIVDNNYRDAVTYGPMASWFNNQASGSGGGSPFMTQNGGAGQIDIAQTGLYLFLAMLQMNLGAPSTFGGYCGVEISGSLQATGTGVISQTTAYNNGVTAHAWTMNVLAPGAYARIGGWTQFDGSHTFWLAGIRIGDSSI